MAEAAGVNGWLVLDKPLGLGSTDAVAAVKRALRQAGLPRAKVGHGGTLDPLATGVLPIALGEATKLAGRLLDATKAYDFTVAFGTQTDTLDAEGAVVATSAVRPTRAMVAAALPRFTGPIRQAPPAYSALKVAGRRAYDLAREGQAVALAERAVTVHALELLPAPREGGPPAPAGGGGNSLPRAPQAESPLHHAAPGPPLRAGEDLVEATFRALVSKGTYVRSLARDLALALGTVGHVTMLRRTRAGPFALDLAVSLDKLAAAATADALRALLLPLTAGLADIPALPVTPAQAQALRQGRRLEGTAAPGLSLAILGDCPVALMEGDRVVRGFNLMSEPAP